MGNLITYAPMADTPNGELFITNNVDTMDVAVKQFDVWEHSGHQLDRCWVDVFQGDSIIKTVYFKKAWTSSEERGDLIGKTLREVVRDIQPTAVGSNYSAGVHGCPSDYSLIRGYANCSCDSCNACWSQIYLGSRKES